MDTPQDILAILDACAEAYTFPMLDNGYVYLAASRLALYRSNADWALTIEIFGFSPRAGTPDTHVQTYGSRLVNHKTSEDFVTEAAYEANLANHPHDAYTSIYPIEEGAWQDPENEESVAAEAETVMVRGAALALPRPDEYARHGVTLEDPPHVQVFEMCRWLAAVARDVVLATPEERRQCVPDELALLLVLEDWHHPDLVNGARPSETATFRQLADVLSTGDVSRYRPSETPNTHWQHWPDGGTL